VDFPGIEGYSLKTIIGQGATGTVFFAERDEDGAPFAVKVLNSMAVNREVIEYTYEQMRHLERPESIHSVYEYDLQGAPLFVSMPFLGQIDEGGDPVPHHLGSLAGRLPEAEVWSILEPILTTIAFLHKHGVIHCNLKPNNVLYEQVDGAYRPRIVDVALGWLGGVHRLDFDPLLPYLSPDQISEPDGIFDGKGPRWDVYSFGVLAYEMITGQVPRGAEYLDRVRAEHDPNGVGIPLEINPTEFAASIGQEQEIVWPEPASSALLEERRRMIEQCLWLDPSRRLIDLREAQQALVVIDRVHEAESAERLLKQAKRRERRKLGLARGLAATAAIGLCGAVAYGYSQSRAKTTAREEKAAQKSEFEGEIASRDSRILSLEKDVEVAVDGKVAADVRFREARTQTDGLLAAVLDPDNDAGDIMSPQQLDDALVFYEAKDAAHRASGEVSEASVCDAFNLALLRRKSGDNDGALELFRRVQEHTAQIQGGAAEGAVRAECLKRAAKASYDEFRMLRDRADSEGSLEALRRSNGLFAELLIEGVRSPIILDRYAEVNLELGRKYRELGRYEEAANAQAQVGRILSDAASSSGLSSTSADILTRSQFELALIRRTQGMVSDAMQLHVDVVDSILPLMEVGVATTEDELLLAMSYTELGELVTQSVGPAEGLAPHREAVELLREVLRSDPSDGVARYYLARNYGELARYDRDSGKLDEALQKQDIGVGLLEGLVDSSIGVGASDGTNDGTSLSALPVSAPPEVRLQCARQKGLLAELLSDKGDTEGALARGDQALRLVEGLEKDRSKLPAMVQKSLNEESASIFGILGHNYEKAGDKVKAKDFFGRAVRQWESIQKNKTQSNVERVTRGLAWSRDRFAKLK